jgi:hypothetical protein
MITALAFIAGFYLGMLALALCKISAMSDSSSNSSSLMEHDVL